MARLAVVVTGLCLLLTACGGNRAAKPRLTRAAFIAAANQVCTATTTRNGRLAGLRALRPARADEDLYHHWLRAEEDALAAAKALEKPQPAAEADLDPQVPLVVAEGKAAGYARRLGAGACVTMAG